MTDKLPNDHTNPSLSPKLLGELEAALAPVSVGAEFSQPIQNEGEYALGIHRILTFLRNYELDPGAPDYIAALLADIEESLDEDGYDREGSDLILKGALGAIDVILGAMAGMCEEIGADEIVKMKALLKEQVCELGLIESEKWHRAIDAYLPPPASNEILSPYIKGLAERAKVSRTVLPAVRNILTATPLSEDDPADEVAVYISKLVMNFCEAIDRHELPPVPCAEDVGLSEKQRELFSLDILQDAIQAGIIVYRTHIPLN